MEDQGFIVDTMGHAIEAVIIGSGALPRELARNLGNRHLGTVLIERQQELDPSLQPEFVFWFPAPSEEPLSEFLKNFLASLKPKLIIVGYDDMDVEGMVSFAVDADLDVRGVVVCDLYGPDVAESTLSILWSRLAENELVLPEADQNLVFPVFIEDAAVAICLAAFSSQTYGRVVTVAGSQEMTILNVASRIRDHFIQATGTMPTFHYEEGVGSGLSPHYERRRERDLVYLLLSWKPSTDLPTGIQRLVAAVATKAAVKVPMDAAVEEATPGKKKIELLSPGTEVLELPASSPIHTPKTPEPSPRSSQRRTAAPKRILIGILSVMVIGGTLVFGFQAVPTAIERLAQQAFDRVSASAREQSLNAASLAHQRLLQLSAVHERVQTVRGGVETLSTLVAQSEVELAIARVLDAATALGGVVSGDSAEHPSTTLLSLESHLSNLLSSIGSLSQFPDAWAAYAPVRQKASLTRELFPILRWVLGFEEKRTILLVVQNASELRPTGGFLTGIGFLTFENGRLLDVSLTDVRAVDEQLTGAEQPPEPIRRLMGEDRWRVRDANWNPDGPQAARDVERMVTRATGRSVDGTVFVTSEGVRRILAQVGPVIAPQGDEFSAQNLIERVTFDGGASFGDAGTTEPLLDAIRGLRGTFTKTNAVRFARGIIDAAIHQELFLTAHQPDIAQIVSLVGFDGAIAASVCPLQFRSTRCTSDYLDVIDANLSVNRADYFLVRERDIRVTLGPSEAPSVTVTLRYRNTATSTARPAGTYHGYTRILLPLDAVVTALTEEKDGSSLEVLADHDVQYGKRVEGFYLHVPVGAETTIRMSYTRGTPFELADGLGGYNLLLQKQPGVISTPTTVTIEHGSSIAPVGISPDAYSQDSSLVFNLVGDQTTNIAVEFASVL